MVGIHERGGHVLLRVDFLAKQRSCFFLLCGALCNNSQPFVSFANHISVFFSSL